MKAPVVPFSQSTLVVPAAQGTAGIGAEDDEALPLLRPVLPAVYIMQA